jgi:hypothetical protein
MSGARDKTEKSDGAVPRVERDTFPVVEHPDLEFHPVEIQGEPLSETIIRERR